MNNLSRTIQSAFFGYHSLAQKNSVLLLDFHLIIAICVYLPHIEPSSDYLSIQLVDYGRSCIHQVGERVVLRARKRGKGAEYVIYM